MIFVRTIIIYTLYIYLLFLRNKVQIVKKISQEKTYPNNTEIRAASNWLADLSLD